MKRGAPFVRDALFSVWELVLANRLLHRTPPGDLRLLPSLEAEHECPALSPRQAALVELVAYVLPVVGSRLPWRSDCLVQAMAGRHWLARSAITSDVCIGVRKDDQGFQAHAWLKVGGRIVTGGDISTYAELPPVQSARFPFAQ